MDADIEKKLTEINEKILDLKLNAAASKPVGDIVKYLIYFWFSMSVILGILGWSKLSDLDEIVNREVNNAVSSVFVEDAEQFRKYKQLIEDTKILHKNYSDLTQEYKTRVDDLKHTGITGIAKPHFDIVGQMDVLIREIRTNDVFNDDEWRRKAILTLQRLTDAITEGSFAAPADSIFNAVQIANQLKQFQLAADMTQIAFDKDPSPPYRSLKLSSQVKNSIGDKRELALSELFEMVRDLDIENSPQIVLSEAWNASEHTRRYGPLLSAIEALIGNKNKEHIPSYVYVTKANLLLRRSWPGDVESARQALGKGHMIFQLESSLSQWAQEFVQEYSRLTYVLDDERNHLLMY